MGKEDTHVERLAEEDTSSTAAAKSIRTKTPHLRLAEQSTDARIHPEPDDYSPLSRSFFRYALDTGIDSYVRIEMQDITAGESLLVLDTDHSGNIVRLMLCRPPVGFVSADEPLQIERYDDDKLLGMARLLEAYPPPRPPVPVQSSS